MMGIGKRERWLVIAAVVCIGLLVGDRFVLTPLWGVWVARSARIAELKRMLSEGEPLLERETAMRQRWNEMQESALVLDISRAEDQMLSAMTEWSRRSGMTITTIKPRWVQQRTYTEMEIQTSARGTMKSLSEFLQVMRRDSLPVRLKSLEIASREDNGREIIINANLSSIVLESENTR